MPKKKSTTKTGRSRKSEGPALPRDEVDRLLVHGEVKETKDGQQVTYPSYRELASRYGVAHSLIAQFSKKHRCLARRKEAKDRTQELADKKMAKSRARQIAVSIDAQIQIIDAYLLEFKKALERGEICIDNPTDFNTMCRLKAFLQGDADSRQEVSGGMITLEEMQKRHKAMLKRWNNSTPEMRGVMPKKEDLN